MTTQPYQLIAQDGAQHPIGPAGLSIGRNRTNDIVIQDPKVSRQHAQILIAEESCWIRDEHSAAGIYVNGKRIAGQQKLHPGDQIQIGPRMFQFAGPSGRSPLAPAGNKKIQPLVWVVGAALILLILGIGLGGGLGVDMSRFTSPAETPTAVVAADQLELVASLTPTSPATPPPTETLAPIFSGTVLCEDLDEYLDRRQCRVTNTSGSQDTLWISFQPYRLGDTNDFNLSILLGASTASLFPERKGLISLGTFAPGETKTFTIQMFCVDTEEGCPLTTIHVQLHANNAATDMTGPDGEFDIQNGVAVTKPTATKRPPTGPQPTGGSQPTVTSTPSDAVGPTPTP